MMAIFVYYASIMFNAFTTLLCSKLCRHNRLKPKQDSELQALLTPIQLPKGNVTIQCKFLSGNTLTYEAYKKYEQNFDII